jgi:hypothetical protein
MILNTIIFISNYYENKHKDTWFKGKHPIIVALGIYLAIIFCILFTDFILWISIQLDPNSLPSWIIVALLIFCIMFLLLAVCELFVIAILKYSRNLEKFYNKKFDDDKGMTILKCFSLSNTQKYAVPYDDPIINNNQFDTVIIEDIEVNDNNKTDETYTY